MIKIDEIITDDLGDIHVYVSDYVQPDCVSWVGDGTVVVGYLGLVDLKAAVALNQVCRIIRKYTEDSIHDIRNHIRK